MTPQQNPEEIFNIAVELSDPEKRSAYLDQVCGGDEKLRAEVDALLNWHKEADSFLNVPEGEAGATLETPVVPDASGTIIGRYKLLEKIGEGGMATVYMAEQKHPIRRRVALKIIKLGMDSKQVIARFEAERQALAMMDHPNIAKVFDAGTTDGGRPYFVMELVKGLAITEFCDSNHLTTQERLDLFISVCQAVQHAHQRGIIHRDIKPTNILATLHDGRPVVKVIDFGIAKAVNQQLTEKTLFTRFSQMIGTPEYMSPEQAEMSGLDIDTRTDVFSLGVLLYELLTGTTPFDSEYLLSKGYNEMQRIIREEEPVRPSTKVSTLGDSLTEIAKHRRTSPELLCKIIRSDLDWIVMKTLEKDRQRRYESVSELAADVQRHLDNETVLAGRPSTIYKVQKFVKRNKVLVTAVAAVAAVVVIAAILSSILAIRATKARKVAVEAQGIAENARQNEANQREKAELAQEKAEALAEERKRDLYFNHIKLAHQELEKNRPVYALNYLGKCPTELRKWEWHYLHRKSRLQEPPPLKFDANVMSFTFSSDGTKLAAFCDNGQLVIRERVTGLTSSYSVRNKTEQINRDSQSIFCQWVDFCPDAKHIAVIGDDHTVNLFAVVSDEILQPVQCFRGHKDIVKFIDCSPDGNLIVTNSSDNTVRLWDLWSGKQLWVGEFNPKTERVTFSEDAKHLSVQVFSGFIETFDVQELLSSSSTPDAIKNYKWPTYGIAISPDGQRVATVMADNTILIPNDKDNEDIYLRGHADFITAMAFTQDGTRLASTSMDRTMRLWDVKTGREVLLLGRYDPFNRYMAFSGDDQEFILCDNSKTLRVFNASPMATTLEAESMTIDSHSDLIWAVNYSPSGHQLITSDSNSMRLWSPLDGQMISCIDMYSDNAQFSSDGRWIASVGIENDRFCVKVRDANPPHKEHFSDEFTRELVGVTFSIDGRYVIIGGEDGMLRVYDWQSDDKKSYELGKQDAFIVYITASPDGNYLASAGIDGSVMLWDANRLEKLQKARLIYEGGLYYFGVGFSPNSKALAVGGRNGEIRILDVETVETLVSIPDAHGDTVNWVSFSPNGEYLASCSSDQTVRIWKADTGDLVDIFLEHEGPLMSVAFSPDGKHVASVGYERKIRIWKPRLD